VYPQRGTSSWRCSLQLQGGSAQDATGVSRPKLGDASDGQTAKLTATPQKWLWQQPRRSGRPPSTPVSEAVCLLDPLGIVRRCNKAFATFRRPRVLGDRRTELLHAPARGCGPPPELSVGQNAGDEGPQEAEYILGDRWCAWRLTPFSMRPARSPARCISSPTSPSASASRRRSGRVRAAFGNCRRLHLRQLRSTIRGSSWM